jgi:hypothetical protein
MQLELSEIKYFTFVIGLFVALLLTFLLHFVSLF